MAIVDMPMPPDIEDVDWAYCRLFVLERHEWLKHLFEFKQFKLEPGEARPQTPEEYKGVQTNMRLQRNLNPNKRNILTYTECEYALQLIKKQLDEKSRLAASAKIVNKKK